VILYSFSLLLVRLVPISQRETRRKDYIVDNQIQELEDLQNAAAVTGNLLQQTSDENQRMYLSLDNLAVTPSGLRRNPTSNFSNSGLGGAIITCSMLIDMDLGYN
jgi:hypothetical protein